MPITGLTDNSPSFKEMGRLRLGIPLAETAANGPKEIAYFRPDFRPDAADSFAAFLAIYGDQPTEIHIRLPFPQIERCWDAFYEVYNKAGMLGMADGVRWLYLRHNKTGELLVKDGVPIQAQGLSTDDNGMAYLPFDKNTPVYSYKSKNGEDVAIYAKPTGRLKVLIPELKRAAFVQVITHSTYNCRKISSQLAGIQIIAQNVGLTLPMVPMILSRRKELISVSYNGKKSMQEHYLLNIEIDPIWMEAQFRYLDALMPGIAMLAPMQLPAGEDLKPEDVTEDSIPDDDAKIGMDPESESVFFTDNIQSPPTETIPDNGHKPEVPNTGTIDLLRAKAITGTDDKAYGDCTDDELEHKLIGITKALNKPDVDPAKQSQYLMKIDAIKLILNDRRVNANAPVTP